ncbi:hypothetical protein [Costertonia aggregata]|nr:hypothetical protein [Costertonia aggregata]
MCKTCSKATEKNTQLTSLCQKANLHALSDEDKVRMKQQLQNKG